jgi:6-phosphogluconolactonase
MFRRLEVFPTRVDVENHVATELLAVIDTAVRARGRADIVLTGGTVGIGCLVALERFARDRSVAWDSVHVWWGDERFLPGDHGDRNDGQARHALLGYVSIPSANLHPFPADRGQSVDEARDEFCGQFPDGFPEFDVVLNGIGPDGHVASLFPGCSYEVGSDVIAIHNSPKPPAERLSFTFEALNRASRVWIIAAGSDKANAISRLMAESPRDVTPATALQGKLETAVFVDVDAAAEITG